MKKGEFEYLELLSYVFVFVLTKYKQWREQDHLTELEEEWGLLKMYWVEEKSFRKLYNEQERMCRKMAMTG